jgi:hypothetical protein
MFSFLLHQYVINMFLGLWKKGFRVYRRRYGHWVCCRRVGFIGEGFVVVDRGVGFVVGELWVSSEIWPWKLGVGEEASLLVRGDLAGDGGWVGLWRQGFGLGRNQIRRSMGECRNCGWASETGVWVGMKPSTVCSWFLDLSFLF